jgi:hypothetical protein
VGFQDVEEGELPFHFEVTLNPYRRNLGGTYVRIFQKRAITQTREEEARLEREREPMETGIFRIFEGVCKLFTLPSRIILGLGLRFVLDDFFRVKEARHGPVVSYPHLFFFDSTGDREFSNAPVPGIGFEVSVPLEKTAEVVDLIVAILDKDPVVGAIGIRYVTRDCVCQGSDQERAQY